ncbi:hypothetical protein BDQ12DRAFT_713465 [Crucibulum laeve]|uniref:choline-phosphate cytidylyltransferase n=1 Tax=Crucibulum laeve TaxID=68775 RepID=A0A5C3LZ64_9AGAR|nr:hypothetical protein BDQ12DRAFT_713465 [Crucibulum laeve]
MSVEVPRRTLHSKRSFGKYPKMVDSPAYDASEEDNDPLTDDAASAMSVPVAVPASWHPTPNSPSQPIRFRAISTSRTKHLLASNLLSDSDGVDSPTYDGDVESSATLGPDSTSHRDHHHRTDHHRTDPSSTKTHHHRHSSSTSTLSTPLSPTFPSPGTTPSIETSNPLTPPSNNSPIANQRAADANHHPVFISPPVNTSATPLHVTEEPAVPSASQAAFNPAALTVEDIQAFVQRAIDGEPGRKYKINPPPVDRPIRVYADGVYDLFHFGHALQLRQAKLSFPSVYLLVGVCSDELVVSHKARTVMTHAERLEAARHCRWVDEVVAEAPWVIDEAFVKKYEIDYVAHDEDPYVSVGHEDVYAYVKNQGKFIPTRRTPGVSTSELLERIVSGYRKRDFDDKLTKMGHSELRAEGSDYDGSSRIQSRMQSRSTSPMHG